MLSQRRIEGKIGAIFPPVALLGFLGQTHFDFTFVRFEVNAVLATVGDKLGYGTCYAKEAELHALEVFEHVSRCVPERP